MAQDKIGAAPDIFGSHSIGDLDYSVDTVNFNTTADSYFSASLCLTVFTPSKPAVKFLAVHG